MKEIPRIYSYIVTSDTGLAPNPFGQTCTLAVCKPQIRRSALEGDWIIGLSPKQYDYRLVYAMHVKETLTFAEYFQDNRFEWKKPDIFNSDTRKTMGDNFYQPIDNETYVQLPSAHSNPDGTENKKHKTRDLSGRFVLVAKEFYYYGSNGIELPSHLDYLQVGRGHRNQLTPREVKSCLRYVEKLIPGINGVPRNSEQKTKLLQSALLFEHKNHENHQ